MPKIVALLMLALLAGCNAHKPERPLPEGNMPITEQEYQEAKLLLQKKKLPPDEYLRWPNEALSRATPHNCALQEPPCPSPNPIKTCDANSRR